MSKLSKFIWLCVIGGGVGAAYVNRETAIPFVERYAGQYEFAKPALAALKSGVSWLDTAIGSARASTEKSVPPPAKSASPVSPATNPAAQPPAKGGRAGPPLAPVTVATAVIGDMPVVLAAPGAVEPMATVAVRSRVDGQIVKVGFNEGDFVKQGQILFELDDRLAKAQINQAEANVNRDVANLKDAEAILARRDVLVRQKWTSEASAETQRATVESLKASIAAGRALLEAQKTQLDYLVIRAPIAGRTGTIATKLGTAVRSADVAAMVTINQTQPILVTFALPQTELAAVRVALSRQAKAKVTIPGAKPIDVEATLAFVDNQVNQTTGTITAKATAPNPGEALWPGQGVEVALTVEVVPNMVSVPVSAVLPAAEGMIAWVIGADNRVAVRKVEVARIVDQTVFLKSGLAAGDRVVTDGQIRLQPGAGVVIREPAPRGSPGATPAAGDRPPGGNNRS